jgi:MerR family mercuric resistance operon transcriptional regulator
VAKDRFEEEFTIGELSRRLGMNVETIRYYERIALVPRPPRTPGGHRSYRMESLRTLAFIKRSREIGFGIEDIRALLSLRGGQGSCMSAKAIAARHLEAVRAKMRYLAEMEEILAETIDKCSGEKVSECAVLDALETERPNEQRPTP